MMLRTWLLIHAVGTLGTTALVVWRNRAVEAHGHPWRYGLSMLALAICVWPLMLLAEGVRTVWPRREEPLRLVRGRQGIRVRRR